MTQLEKSLYSVSLVAGMAGLLTSTSVFFSISAVVAVAATMMTASRGK